MFTGLSHSTGCGQSVLGREASATLWRPHTAYSIFAWRTSHLRGFGSWVGLSVSGQIGRVEVHRESNRGETTTLHSGCQWHMAKAYRVIRPAEKVSFGRFSQEPPSPLVWVSIACYNRLMPIGRRTTHSMTFRDEQVNLEHPATSPVASSGLTAASSTTTSVIQGPVLVEPASCIRSGTPAYLSAGYSGPALRCNLAAPA